MLYLHHKKQQKQIKMKSQIDYSLKSIKVLGYTTDFQQCECCGKSDLKGTVAILDLNYDVVLHFGTTCAVNANKYDNLDCLKAAKKEINSLKREREDNIKFARTMCWKFKIANMEPVIEGYLKMRENRETRYNRYNWEQHIIN